MRVADYSNIRGQNATRDGRTGAVGSGECQIDGGMRPLPVPRTMGYCRIGMLTRGRVGGDSSVQRGRRGN